MKRNNKRFIISLIGLTIIGLVTLMIVMFVVLSNYMKKQDSSINASMIVTRQVDTEIKVKYSTTLLVLVEKVTNYSVTGLDIENNKEITRKISGSTRVNDAYGSAVPISQIKSGDIIELVYQEEDSKVISINKTNKAKIWRQISGITVNEEDRLINIGGINYQYTDKLLVLDSKGNRTNMAFVGPFDVVTLQGIDTTVWSITIEEAEGSIQIVDLPTLEGELEIDRSRFIKLNELEDKINIIPGDHKIVLNMKGYEVISETIAIEPGQHYKISLKDAEKAYTTVIPIVGSSISDYTITINDTIYSKAEEIKLQQGTYKVKAVAEGYEPWERELICNKESQNLYISFIKIEEEVITNNVQNPKNNEVLNNSHTINLNTDPIDAKVYIDDIYKGVTPCTVTLTNGSYTMFFEKEGYSVYTTSIILNNSSDQNLFLYALTEN